MSLYKKRKSGSSHFPFLGVTLSGGHTQLVWVESHFEMKEIGKLVMMPLVRL